jgi:hypothetical protein
MPLLSSTRFSRQSIASCTGRALDRPSRGKGSCGQRHRRCQDWAADRSHQANKLSQKRTARYHQRAGILRMMWAHSHEK